MRRYALILAALTAHTSAMAQGQPLAFISCPVFRNVHEMRGCFITEYQGEWYYLGSPGGVIATGSLPPQLKHRALVEGVVQPQEPRVCGGLVLSPVKVSPLQDLDLRCNTVLPADGYSIPMFNAKVGIPDTSKLTPPPKPPFGDQDFEVEFYFDTPFLGVMTQLKVQQAAIYATTSQAPKVIVRAFRGATRLSNGHVLAERAGIAEVRARKLASSLVDLGVAAERVQLEFSNALTEGDAVTAPARRNAHIQIKGLTAPGGS